MSMYARAHSGTVVGVDAHPVMVESQRARGLPGMTLIGLARGAARESLVRVRAAIVAGGSNLGSQRLVVNLLPAELPKEASALDLPLAVSLLASAGIVPTSCLERRRFYGELSLAGTLESVRGAVLVADLARRSGDTEIILPVDNAAEAAIIPDIQVVGAKDLTEVAKHLRGEAPLAVAKPKNHEAYDGSQGCLGDVCGQSWAKRALEIVAAGGHNLLMIGPPGSGKTMLARRLPSILPQLSPDESVEVTRIHSAAGLLSGGCLVTKRPFRAPHHTASEPALCGGGSMPRPGEVTLAHRGVLFLDELPEFSRKALESLREPLEEGMIHIARAAMSLSFPANVLLIAAMNPCPCGRFRGDGRRTGAQQRKPGGDGPKVLPCMCTYDQVQRYRSRISGPLLDRIDVHVLVDAVPYREYANSGTGEASNTIRTRVERARMRQVERLGSGRTNAAMTQAELRSHVLLGEKTMQLIEQAIDTHGLSTRAIGRALKVARTIADLSEERTVSDAHVEEALRFRILDRGTDTAISPRIELAAMSD